MPEAHTVADGRRRRLRNVFQELVLLGGIALAAGLVAWLLFGVIGLLSVLISGLLVAAVRPRVPVALVLWVYRAEPLPRWAAPQLHRIVDVLAVRARLRWRPALYYVASPLANAFVVGTEDQAALAVTDGLLRQLNGRQVAGVLAHEVSHLHNGDTAVMNLSDLVARLAQWMAWFGLGSVLVTVPLALWQGDDRVLLCSAVLVMVPTLVTLVQLALSRSREYDADLDAAVLTGDPEGLAGALLVLEMVEGRIWERILVGRSRGPDPLLLQTHPRTGERVRRLRALEARERAFATAHPAAPSGYPPVTRRPQLRRTGVRW